VSNQSDGQLNGTPSPAEELRKPPTEAEIGITLVALQDTPTLAMIVRRLAFERHALRERLEKCIACLNDIDDPLAGLRRECEAKGQDYELDAQWAIRLIQDPQWIRGKASAVLAALEPTQEAE